MNHQLWCRVHTVNGIQITQNCLSRSVIFSMIATPLTPPRGKILLWSASIKSNISLNSRCGVFEPQVATHPIAWRYRWKTGYKFTYIIRVGELVGTTLQRNRSETIESPLNPSFLPNVYLPSIVTNFSALWLGYGIRLCITIDNRILWSIWCMIALVWAISLDVNENR